MDRDGYACFGAVRLDPHDLSLKTNTVQMTRPCVGQADNKLNALTERQWLLRLEIDAQRTEITR